MNRLTRVAVALAICLISTSIAFASPVRFGVPPWPGVTVKTEVTMQLMDALGYQTESIETTPPVIYQGLPAGDLEVFMGGWMPQQETMITPQLKKKKVVVAATNLDEAIISLAVPNYVWEAGVRSIADLAKHADKFEHTIYNVEPGAGMHTAVEDMIAANVANLGDWEQQGSTTPMMLTQVRDLIREGKWVVFGAWKPHWMNELIDMKYLTGVPGSENLVSNSTVLTVVAPDFEKKQPSLYRMLSQIKVSAAMQNKWIHDFGYKKIPAKDVAKAWIAANPDVLKKWLNGVKDASGNDAFTTLQKTLAAK